MNLLTVSNTFSVTNTLYKQDSYRTVFHDLNKPWCTNEWYNYYPYILLALQPWVSLGLLNDQSLLLSIFRLLHPLLYLRYFQVCYNIIHPSQARSSFYSSYEQYSSHHLSQHCSHFHFLYMSQTSYPLGFHKFHNIHIVILLIFYFWLFRLSGEITESTSMLREIDTEWFRRNLQYFGNDSMCDSKQQSSYEHVSDFGRLRSYDRLKLRREGNDYWQ